jgi:NOL1/NOP2/sun family putative RNA methylase
VTDSDLQRLGIELPGPFVKRMQQLLGAEASDFLACLAAPPQPGLRVNSLKVSPLEFQALSTLELEAVPWCPDSYLVSVPETFQPGRDPYHAGGLYYVQDPSAAAASVLLDPQPGDSVLDLCAAPGGKATHIAARLQGQGLLVANEIRSGRAATLVENLERIGARAAVVTSASADVLARHWVAAFDRVLVDAPCSGEGLFRKNMLARREWRPAVVEGCALRQRSILAAGADMVRPGGRLVYSTCTFAPEENEAVVAQFLRDQPEFALIPPPPLPGFEPGRPDWVAPSLAKNNRLERCVRLWPHRSPGEGHFMATFDRQGQASAARWAPAGGSLPRKIADLLRQFWDETLLGEQPGKGWLQWGQSLYLSPMTPTRWRFLRPVRPGWHVGQIGPSHFAPAHALAMALKPSAVRPTKRIDLTTGSPELEAFLRGEPLRLAGLPRWSLVTVDGFALGWGKRVGEVVKNHYPRSLRWRN